MGSGHWRTCTSTGTTPLHRLPAHAKLVGLVAFMLARRRRCRRGSRLGPRGAAPCWPRASLSSTRVPVRHLLPRLVVELPVRACSRCCCPFVAIGPASVVLGPFTVSQPGLDAAVALLLKGTCGVLAAVAFAATTQPPTSCAACSGCGCPTRSCRSRASWSATSTSSPTRCAGCGSPARSRGFTAPLGARLAGAGREHRRAVHPLLRARRAGAPRDAQPRLLRPAAGHRTARATPAKWALAWRRPPSPPSSPWGCGSDERARPRRARPRLRLPRRPPGPVRRRPARAPGRAGRAARPERRRQDDAGAAPQRHPHPGRRQRHGVAGCRSPTRNLLEVRRRVGIVFQDPDDQLFMPTVRDDVAFGPANLGLRGAELEAPGGRGARPGRDGATSPTGRRTTSPSASAAGSPSPPCWRCDPRSWCSTSRRRTSTRPRAASSPTSCARSTSPC